MSARSKGMHIHGTRVAAARFRRHLTRTAEPEAVDPFEPRRRASRADSRERLEHLHEDFELEQRFARDDAA